MNAPQLLDRLTRNGVKVWREGERLQIKPPKPLKPELIELATVLKSELLSLVEEQSEPAPALWLADFSELIARARRGELAKGRRIALTACAMCEDLNLYVTLAEPRIERLRVSNLLRREGLLEQEREMLESAANAQATIDRGA